MIPDSLPPPPPTTNIVFECSDIKRDMGLLLLKRKIDDKFELHLHNDYTSQAIAMVLSIEDFVNMFDALGPYFLQHHNQRSEIEI